MPEPKLPSQKSNSSPEPKQDQKPVPKEKDSGSVPKKPSPPKPKKDESLKYSMTYANGGFNNGVELRPGKDGKIELSITIYGGGEKKYMGISGFSPEVKSIVQAYQVAAETGQNSEDVKQGLKEYFTKINATLSMKIIQILQEADSKIQDSIKQTFKEVK